MQDYVITSLVESMRDQLRLNDFPVDYVHFGYFHGWGEPRWTLSIDLAKGPKITCEGETASECLSRAQDLADAKCNATANLAAVLGIELTPTAAQQPAEHLPS